LDGAGFATMSFLISEGFANCDEVDGNQDEEDGATGGGGGGTLLVLFFAGEEDTPEVDG